MSEIFIQLNTHSGSAFFYDAKLPDDAIKNAPEHVIFIPVDQEATLKGTKYPEQLTEWFVVVYLDDDGRTVTLVAVTQDIFTHLSDAGISSDKLVSIERLTSRDFQGTPFYLDVKGE